MGIIQLPVVAQDIVEGVQQGKKQPWLTMVIPVVVGRVEQIDVIDDIWRRAQIDFPLPSRGGETEELTVLLIWIPLVVTQNFEIVDRLADSLFVGDADGAIDITLGCRLAEFAGRMAAADCILISGKACDMAETAEFLAATLVEGLIPGRTEECETRLCQRVEIILFGIGREFISLGRKSLGSCLHIAVKGVLLFGIHGSVRDAYL